MNAMKIEKNLREFEKINSGDPMIVLIDPWYRLSKAIRNRIRDFIMKFTGDYDFAMASCAVPTYAKLATGNGIVKANFLDRNNERHTLALYIQGKEIGGYLDNAYFVEF